MRERKWREEEEQGRGGGGYGLEEGGNGRRIGREEQGRSSMNRVREKPVGKDPVTILT